MNKHLHRIVFNAARGMRMVVQETAMSAGKATGATAVVTVAALASMLVPIAASAQIAGAQNVPNTLRPTVLVAPNGVPLVNIQTPSAAGVSRNVYNQFDVGTNGAILNNSRTNVQTQLGGYVQGNPYLANGPARIILNEVNGGNPSQLRGFIEVGGSRAEVIIANPAGIAVNGGGFINASKATLTTGTPQLNALGGLDSFLVRGGTISIDGAGLDLSRTDYAAILTRALQVNAAIYATDLKVVTGTNQVSADTSHVSSTTGTGQTPTFALDVSALGGMYAGKITLIGTEAGLGVRNAGTIQAAPNSGTTGLVGIGQLVVTSAGRLENSGAIQAAADADLSATSIANGAQIAAAASLKLTSAGDLGNSGSLEGQRVELNSTQGNIDNRGGTIRQTSYASLTVAAPTVSNTQGGWIGAEPTPAPVNNPGASAGAGSPTGSTGNAGTGGTTSTGGSTGGATSTPASTPVSPGSVTATGTVYNDGGKIYAGGPISLQSANLNNNGGTLSVASMTLSQPSFSNRGGALNVSGALTADVGSFDNSTGTLHAGSLNITASGDLLNVDGSLTSDNDTTLAVGGNVDNTRGAISAINALNGRVAGAVTNTSGTLVSNEALSLSAASLGNTHHGSIQSTRAGVQLNVGGQVQNAGGNIGAATDLTLQAGTLANGAQGSIRASNDATLTVSGAVTNDGSITAGRHTTVSAGSSQGGRTGMLGAGINADGSLGRIGNLSVSATQAFSATGTHIAAGSVALEGGSVDLSSSQTSAANVAITAHEGNVTTSDATISTPGTLSVTANRNAGQTLINRAGTLSANQLDLHASNITNTAGGHVVQTGAGGTTIASSGALINDGGTIASNGQDLSVQAGSISNTAGTIQHAGTGSLRVTAYSFGGAQGKVTSNGELDVRVAGSFDQTSGSTAAQQIHIAAGSFTNEGGSLASAKQIDLSITNALNNAKGQINAGTAALTQAGSLNNDGGTITAQTDIKADVAGATSNQGGTLVANGDARITTGSLANQGGKVFTLGKLEVQSTGALNNNAGQLIANQAAQVGASALTNRQGVIQSSQSNATVQVGQSLDNTQGIVSAATDLQVASGSLTNGSGGSLRAERDATVNVTNALIQESSLTAGRHVTVNAGSVQSGSAGVFAAGLQSDDQLGSTGDLSITAQQGLIAQGTNIAASKAALQGGAADLSSSLTSARHIAITATQGNVTTSGAAVVAGSLTTPGTLTISANTVQGQSLVNQGGGLNADQLRINAGAIDNSNAGQISQTGSGTFQITTPGGLDNSAGGRITSPGTLDVQAGGVVNNNLGLMASTGALSLRGASLSNDGGTVASAKDNLRLQTIGAVSNKGGYLQAAHDLDLQSMGLVNDLGSVTTGSDATHSLIINAGSGSLSNARGTIASVGTLGIVSGALDNDGGLIQSGAALSINTQSRLLSNTNAARYATGKGGIVSQDTLNIQSANLNNTAGFIGAKNALTGSMAQLTNDNGQIIGRGTSSLATTGFTNQGGQIQSVGDLGLTTGSATLDNTAGLLRSSGNTTLNAGALRNNNTTGTEQGIEGNNVSITSIGAAGRIDNRAGAIRATSNLTLESAGAIDNTTGLLAAGDTLALKDPSAAQPAAMTLAITNTGGTVLAGRALTLQAANVTQDGQLLSLGDLSLTQKEDIAVASGGRLVANGDLTLNTSGKLTNAGLIASGKALTIGAANLDNQATGEISSGTRTTLNISDTLTNRGLIDGGTTVINAGTLNNIGTGRIYGDEVSIGARTVNNQSEALNGVTTAGTIAARQRLDMGVGTLNNLDGALIYSAGNAYLGGALDNDGSATGAATAINNRGATIQAAGVMGIHTNTLNNSNAGVTWVMQPTASVQHNEYQQLGSIQRLDANNVVYTTGPSFLADLSESVWPNAHGVLADASAPSAPDGLHGFIYTGFPPYTMDSAYRPYIVNSPRNSMDMSYCRSISTDSCVDVPMPGAWYAASDPIWRVFGVAPPDALSPGYLDHNIHVGQTQYQSGFNQWTDFPDGPVTQAQYDQWIAAHSALDAATKTMIETVIRTSSSQFTVWSYTETGQTPVLTSSAPGRILSGGAMDLNIGSGTNASSQIVAGGTLRVSGGSLTNTSTQVDSTVDRTGFVYTNSPFSALPYNDSTPRAVTLAAARLEGNAGGTGGYTIGSATGGRNNQSISATGAATGNLDTVAIGNPRSGGSSTVHPIVQVAAVNGAIKAPMPSDRVEAGTVAPNGGSNANPAIGSAPAAGAVIRTTTPNTTVPTASLFQIRPTPGSRYLIETDPRFAGYRAWLSADYLLGKLGMDPRNTLKRLSDGYYEQQLITQQVMQLTGQRYIEGYSSDATQYTALMNAGATFAQQYHLTPGVALTAAQMAQLTSDIVWLVEQTVTLPDGSTQQVLVPQVYVRAQAGDLDGSSGLLAGHQVGINLSGDLNNSATIAGRQLVSLSAENIGNAGRISSDNVAATARVDLSNLGGVITGQSAVALAAGRDLTIASTTRSNVSGSAGLNASALNPVGHTLSTVEIERPAGIYVTGRRNADGTPGAGTLTLDAGRDLNIYGATVSNTAGKTNLSAGRDVNLGTVDTWRGETDVFAITRGNAFAPNFGVSGQGVQIGSTITASDDVNIAAGHDINAIGAHIASSQGSVNLGAGNDIQIVAGVQTIDTTQVQHSGRRGIASETGILNSLPTTIAAARNVTLEAGRDITIAGAHIAAGADAATQAQMLADSQPLDTRRPTLALIPDPDPASPSVATPVAPTSGTVTLTAGRNITLVANALQSSLSQTTDHGAGNYNQNDIDILAAQGTRIRGATVTLNAGQDLTSVASTLNAGTLNLGAGHDLNLLTATQHNNHSTSSYSGDSLTIDQVSMGSKEQISAYNQIQAGQLNVRVGNQIHSQVGGTIRIEELAQQPGMGWINTLMNDPANAGKLDWERIQLTQERWSQSSNTLGPVAQAVLVAVVSFATVGAGSAAMGSSASAMPATTAMVQAGISSIATQASVSFVNNNGDIGAVLTELSSIQGIRNTLSAIITAGVLQGLDSTFNLDGINARSPWQDILRRNLIEQTGAALVNAAIQGTSLQSALQSGLFNGLVSTGATVAAFQIGELGPGGTGANANTLNSFTAAVAHAAVGCLAGAARGSAGGSGTSAGSGCSAGALGAVIGDLATRSFWQDNPNANPADVVQVGRLVAGIVGAAVGGGQAAANIAADAAQNAVVNNLFNHFVADANGIKRTVVNGRTYYLDAAGRITDYYPVAETVTEPTVGTQGPVRDRNDAFSAGIDAVISANRPAEGVDSSRQGVSGVVNGTVDAAVGAVIGPYEIAVSIRDNGLSTTLTNLGIGLRDLPAAFWDAVNNNDAQTVTSILIGIATVRPGSGGVGIAGEGAGAARVAGRTVSTDARAVAVAEDALAARAAGVSEEFSSASSVRQLTSVERATGGQPIEVNPAELRWTQTTAGGNGRADTMRASMAEMGYNFPPIDVVKTPSGIVTVDHTRAAVALEQGITSIPAILHLPTDPLPANIAGRFGSATTWGEAAAYRAANQRPPLPPDGTLKPPKLPAPK